MLVRQMFRAVSGEENSHLLLETHPNRLVIGELLGAAQQCGKL